MMTVRKPSSFRSSALWIKLHLLKRRLGLLGKPTSQIFEEIYQKNDWDDDESVSGHGSRLDRTANIRAALPSLLQRYQCLSLLDIPCGDFNWMKTVALDVDYVGADIVGDLIRCDQ